jgi:hypothetical protein
MNDIYQVMKGTKFYTKPFIVNIMPFAAENELMVVLGESINCTQKGRKSSKRNNFGLQFVLFAEKIL